MQAKLDKKSSLFWLFIISACINFYFIINKIITAREERQKNSLMLIKDISHKEGYSFFTKKINDDFNGFNLLKKSSVILFWDTLNFDFLIKPAMLSVDSLSTKFGKYSFNYFFITEVEESAAKNFLLRNGVSFSNFKVLGGMDDFMSGVYNDKPIKWSKPIIIGDSTKAKLNSKFPKIKVKPYYFIMDKDGHILYYSYKIYLPSRDTELINRLKSLSQVKEINKIKN